MKQTCLQCGKKLSFLSNKFEVKEGVLCSNKCYLQYKKNPKSVRNTSIKASEDSIKASEEKFNKCPECGKKNSNFDAFCSNCGAKLKEDGIREKNRQKHGIPALLSLVFPGLGQIVKGEVGDGIGIMILTILSIFSMTIIIGFITTPIIWIWNVYDAYNSN